MKDKNKTKGDLLRELDEMHQPAAAWKRHMPIDIGTTKRIDTLPHSRS